MATGDVPPQKLSLQRADLEMNLNLQGELGKRHSPNKTIHVDLVSRSYASQSQHER